MQTRLLKFFLLFILPAVSEYAIGQTYNPYYNFKQLSVQNGLVQDIVYHFLQDSRGYLWIGTRNGISLYDGIRTINFRHDDQRRNSVAGNFITRIMEDSDQVVWIGNDAGIDQFNQSDNSFTHYSIPMADGHSENAYCILLGFSNAHDLWFIDTYSKGLKIFNTKTKKFRFVVSTEAVDGTLHVNPLSGTVEIWTYLSMATSQLIFKNDLLISKDQFFDGGKNKNQKPLLIFHVYYQNDSTVWLATAMGLIDLNPKTRQFVIYNTLDNQAVHELRYVARSPGGLLWVATGNNGIYTFDTQEKKFIANFRKEALDPFSICSSNIVSLYFDQVGNIWCGSYGNGVSYAHIENNFFLKHLSKNELEHWKQGNNVSWIGTDMKNNIWCMMQDVQGFCLLDSSLGLKEFRRPLLDNGKRFVAAVYQLLFNGNSTAWCTTDRGLFLYNVLTNRIKQVDYPQQSKSLFGSYWSKIITRLQDSSIIFSTFGGVYRISNYQGRENITPLPVSSSQPAKPFDMIFEDSARQLYIKDTGDSLYILTPTDGHGNYKIRKEIAFRPAVKQFQDAGPILYMATDAGLFLLHKDNLQIEPSPINKLLPFSSVENLLVKGNKVWLFGEKGLFQYNITEKTGRLFSIEDGLPSNNFKEYSFLHTSTGNCIVGTNNGILSFYPEKLHDIVYPPRAQLINMYVNDSSTGFLANPQECDKVVLDYDQNTFSFDYSCISFQHAQASEYEYKLERFDENWIRGGTMHYTRYSRIAPGSYKFHLRAIDAKGQISPFTKTLGIEIRKAICQKNSVRMIMLLVLGLLIWQIIKWYLRTRIQKQQIEFEKLQAIEKERTRIATDMHDDLGAGLSRIKFLSETIGMKKQLQQPIEEDITSIGNYANEMIGKMGEIVWALNEKNDSLSDLLSYTRSYAVEYLLNNGIRCEVEAPDDFPPLFVSGEFRRNIYLTMKEALHNIVKHAKASHVMITIEIEKNLTVGIQDDGIGFDGMHIRPFSNGLNNMQKRISDISGRMEIIHKKGTLIRLFVPLPV